MELHKASSTPYVKFFINNGYKLALKRAGVPTHEAYNDAGTVTLGDYEFTVPETHSLQEFATEFNKNEILQCSYDGQRWTVQPKEHMYGQLDFPENTFISAHGVKRRVEVRGSDYYIVDVIDLSFDEDYIHFEPAELWDVNQYKKYTAVNALDIDLIGAQLARKSTAITMSNGAWATGKFQDVSMSVEKSILESTVQDAVIRMAPGDKYVTSQKFPGRFMFDLHGEAEGFLMNSPNISIVGAHNTVFGSFRLRAGELISLKHFTKIQQIDSRANHFFVELHSNKIQIWEDVDGTLNKILQGDVNVPANSQLMLTAVDTIEIAPPKYQTLKELTADSASVCLAVETAATNTFNILQTNVIKLDNTSGFLQVNGVTTTVPLASGTSYVLSASFVGTRVEASALHISTGALSQYASSSDEATFVSQSSYSANFTAISVEGKLGELILVYGNSDAIEKQILAHVLAKYWPSRETNLGTYTHETGDFSTGAAYNNTTGVLTYGEAYARLVPTIDFELQDIFRTDGEIYAKTEGKSKGYEQRVERNNIRCIGVGCSGMDGEGLIYSGKASNGHIEVSNPEYFAFDHTGRAVVYSSFIDAQNGDEREHTTGQTSYTISVK